MVLTKELESCVSAGPRRRVKLFDASLKYVTDVETDILEVSQEMGLAYK